MNVISVKSYADFVLVAKKLPNTIAVFYNDSVMIAGSMYGVAYAINSYGVAVCAEIFGGITFSLTDFPGAIQIGAQINLSDTGVNNSEF